MEVQAHNMTQALAMKRERLVQENRQRATRIREGVTKKRREDLPARLSANLEPILGRLQAIPSKGPIFWYDDP